MDIGYHVGPFTFTGLARPLYDGAILDRRLWWNDGSRNDGRFWIHESIGILWNDADVVDPDRFAGIAGVWCGCADQQPDQAPKLSTPRV